MQYIVVTYHLLFRDGKRVAMALKSILHVQPGLNSFSNAVKEAKRRGIESLYLLDGVHDEGGKKVIIDFPKGEEAEAGSGSCTPIPGRKQVTDCTLNVQYLDNTHIAPSNWTCQSCTSIKHGKGADCSVQFATLF